MEDKPLGIGVVGCGGFGLFALQMFTQHPDLHLVGLANTHREAAYAAAKRFGIPDPVEIEELCSWDNVDIIYIATPPFLHYPQAMCALKAGKHVICEKPLAMNMQEADDMVRVAEEKNLLLIANLMQRYNPFYQAVKTLIDEHVLGDLLHAYFENYASDEGLPHDHWFWDREKSGGIFIEHGVHFFDLFMGWLGDGHVEAAQVSQRPGTEIEDQVQCSVRFRDSILVNFYHGFTQPGRMDRQELRLLFERGDVTLHEWVPTVAKIHAIVDEAQTRRLMEIFPAPRLDVTAVYAADSRRARARNKPLDIYQMIDIHSEESAQKMHVYSRLLRSLIQDQVQWIRDRNHTRVITEQNGVRSLEMACDADALARAPVSVS